MSNYTEAQLIALRQAIATGAMTVEYEGRRITYRSLNDMLSLLRIMEADVLGIQHRRVVNLNVAYSKGL
ncbi:phage head-tail joining protein [Marinivivus vitaminiproducens]|uniref:phage head-tail joining protein n=1 Tax=Marinivivus vitaminiproducens TaxID=3035935 RepID=UPI0027A25A8D|nr:hypothetical protein P4R82_08105 [Geminicoccaceae bacterium SCSIO 64248]